MLAVVRFQAGEVPFQPVCSGWDVRIVEVVEHVGQSAQKHAAGTFYVAKNPALFFAGSYCCTMLNFPFGDETYECFPVRCCSDPGDPQEDLLEADGRGRSSGSFYTSSTPVAGYGPGNAG